MSRERLCVICLSDEAEDGPSLGLNRGPCRRPEPCTYFLCRVCMIGGGGQGGWKPGRCAICRDTTPGQPDARDRYQERETALCIGYIALIINLLILVSITRQISLRKSISYKNLRELEALRGNDRSGL